MEEEQEKKEIKKEPVEAEPIVTTPKDFKQFLKEGFNVKTFVFIGMMLLICMLAVLLGFQLGYEAAIADGVKNATTLFL
jgi:hypothetical protein